MLSTPGEPQQQLIQQLARTYGGQPTPINPPQRFTPAISVDGLTNSYTVPPQLTPYGAFHEAPGQDELGPNAGVWGSPPSTLHPMIQAALDKVRSAPAQVSENGLGMHPQIDRFHAIHASQALAALMAGLTQRTLARNQYLGRH